MTARTYAALFGAIYLAFGIAGFVPAFWERPPADSTMSIRVFHASLFGLFVVNIISSMAHLVIGLWGAMAANNRYSALAFTRGATILFLLMGIVGLIPIPVVKSLYGTLPLYGNNVWLHFASAAIGVFFSFRPGYALTDVGTQAEMNPHMPNK
ncbi:MAG TPA: DUF4383 domain-containing protein [Burkholderiales bacterium]|nr:DUF4383 domain-containing protein [Burkholderiales bacterium]